MSFIGVLRQRALNSSAEFVEPLLGLAQLYSDRERMHSAVAGRHFREAPAGLFLEFGVFEGHSLRRWADSLPPGAWNGVVHGFDSFEGLRDPWSQVNIGVGSFRTSAPPEDLDGATIVRGWVEDTVDGFLGTCEGVPVAFAHLDLDTYLPTAYVLERIRGRLVEGSLLLFDELVGYPGWQQHEFRALQQWLPPDSYEFLAFSEEQALLRMRRCVP